jgi:hypothetical protein
MFFFAQLSDKSYINIPADRMEVTDNMVYIYDGSQLVALVDVSVILSAHISRKNIGSESL